jgi:hypothetical protein
MENRKITIENGIVHIPSETKMSIPEIANLFGIYYQTAKRFIRDVEKSGVAGGDYSLSCTVEGEKIYPDYYGLEMVIAIAFRVQSVNAEVLRRWIYRRAERREIPKILMLPIQNSMLN